MDSPSTDTNSQKKDPFENLSKEELIKKCKHYLGLAQKAKYVKDELTEENKDLALKLSKLEAKSQADLRTMQEMLDALTQQKLQMVTINDGLKNKVSALDGKLKECKNALIETDTKAQRVDTENEGLNRLVKRLTDENEQLITHLDVLEKQITELNKIGEQQREQLLSLEERSTIDNKDFCVVEKDNTKQNIETTKKIEENTLNRLNEISEKNECRLIDLEKNCRFLENEIKRLDAELSNSKTVIKELNSKLSTKDTTIISLRNEVSQANDLLQATSNNLSDTRNKLVDLSSELEQTKALKDKYNEKLKSYHAKLIKVFSDVKELKLCKSNLLIVVQEYSDHICRWQKEMVEASQFFNKELASSKIEVQELTSLNELLKHQCLDLTNECDNLKSELSTLNILLADNTHNDNSIVINETDTKNKILLEKVDELTKQLKYNEGKLLKISANNDNLQEVIENKLMEIVQSYKEESVESRILHLKLTEMEQQNSELMKVIEDNNKELEKAKGMKILKENMEQEQHILKQEMDKIDHNLQQVNKTYEKQKKEFEELKRENENLLQLTEQINTTKTALDLENKKLLSDLENNATEFEKMKLEKDKLEQSKIQLQNILEQELKKNESEEHNTRQINENYEKQKKEFEELKQENKKLLQLTEQLNTMKAELDLENKRFLSDLENKTKEFDKIKLDNDKLEQTKVQLQNIIVKIQQELQLSQKIVLLKEELQKERDSILELFENAKENSIRVIGKLDKEKVELLKEMENMKKELEKTNELKIKKDELENEKINLLQVIEDNKKELECIKDINAEKGNLETEKNELEKSLKTAADQQNEYKEMINQLTSQVENINEIKENFEKEKIEYNQTINHLNYKLEEMNSKNEQLLKEKKDLLTSLENSEIQQHGYKETINKLNKEFDKMKSVNESKDQLEMENNTLLTSLENSETQQNKIKEKLHELQEEISKKEEIRFTLQKENEKLTEKITVLNEKINNFNKEISNFRRDCSELQNQLTISKRENVELLKEMNYMNQALKERGETISKQQEYAQELTRKLQNSEQEAVQNKHQSEKLEEQLKNVQTQQQDILSQEDNDTNREEKLKKLEQEIQHLREALNNTNRDITDGCGDSEVISTSTVSRLDEAARLKDLEGSWEERYSKLRTLALKLKGKVKELTEQLTLERTEKTDMQSKLSDTQSKLTSNVRNLQNMQAQFDKIQNNYEEVQAENKKYIDNINGLMLEKDQLKQEITSSLENISKLQLELDAYRKKKDESDSVIKQLTNQIQILKKDLENADAVKKELDEQLNKQKMDLQNKEENLQKELKRHKETKDLLLKSKQDCQKKSVLNLEMEDYERSLKETYQKMEKKDETIFELKKKLDQEENIRASMKEQVHLLEERIITEEAHTKELDLELLEVRKKLSEAEAIISQKENRIRETIHSLEVLKTSNEETISQMAFAASQNQKQIESLRTEKDYFKSQVLGLEEKARELTTDIKEKEQELIRVETEFNNYKIRAQSVLKQNKTRDLGVEERLNEEVTTLRSQTENLTAHFDSTSKNLEHLQWMYNDMEKENKKLINQNTELQKALTKEKTDNKMLLARQEQLINEHREASRAQKVHTDTLAQCYKQQLTEQEERHIRELSEIKSQHQAVQEEAMDISFMKREDAEGSESLESSSNNTTSRNVPLSLEKLLSMDSNLSTTDIEAELTTCKQQLSQCEARVSHLTDLLADAEQDLAKHAQLNQILKEEIRRQQRSVEREKHAENLEYLKNVVFKFITLQNNDEKIRLVPVLTTILKLSPEETHKLNAVAKGPEPIGRGWGSYLPSWPGVGN